MIAFAKAVLLLLSIGGYVGALTFVMVKIADAKKRGNG